MGDDVTVYMLLFGKGEAVRYYSPELRKGVSLRNLGGTDGSQRYLEFTDEDRELVLENINHPNEGLQAKVQKKTIPKSFFEDFIRAAKSAIASRQKCYLDLEAATSIEEKIRTYG